MNLIYTMGGHSHSISCSIHGVPVVGRIPLVSLVACLELEEVTPSEIWQGLKCIYVTDRKFQPPETSGLYVKPSGENSWVDFVLTYADGEEQEVFLEGEDHYPLIIVCGDLLDEYNFAFNLLHEVGHHNGIMDEVEAHLFAYRILKDTRLNQENEVQFKEWDEFKKRLSAEQ